MFRFVFGKQQTKEMAEKIIKLSTDSLVRDVASVIRKEASKTTNATIEAASKSANATIEAAQITSDSTMKAGRYRGRATVFSTLFVGIVGAIYLGHEKDELQKEKKKLEEDWEKRGKSYLEESAAAMHYMKGTESIKKIAIDNCPEEQKNEMESKIDSFLKKLSDELPQVKKRALLMDRHESQINPPKDRVFPSMTKK